MEEHLSSFNATQCKAAKCLESSFERMKDVYHSGVLGTKELAISLIKKAFSDLEQTKYTISYLAMAVENFLPVAVTEANLFWMIFRDPLQNRKACWLSQHSSSRKDCEESCFNQVISKLTINFSMISIICKIIEASCGHQPTELLIKLLCSFWS